MDRRLDVLICTFGMDGIRRVVTMDLPRVPSVTYVVSWQVPGDCVAVVPEELSREDVEVYKSDTRGLSVNRNEALSHARGDICLIADDDLVYEPWQLEAVIAAFEEHPEVDLATFRYDGADKKNYPCEEADLNELPKGYWVTSFEIAFRRESVAGVVRFNENFGIGAPLFHAGEENMFLLECRRRGLTCRFFPLTVTSHPGLTTGLRRLSHGAVMANGAYIRCEYGWKGFPRLILLAWRSWRNGRYSLSRGLYYALKGFFIGRRFSRDMRSDDT